MAIHITNNELAVLGLLAEQDKYGYQIEQDIDQRGMRQWTDIAFSSIYYLLGRLEQKGWLAAAGQSTGDYPARKVYRLTAAGAQAYREAVRQRLAAPRPRTGDFDLALANLVALSTGEVQVALEAYHSRLVDDLEQAKAKWAQDRQAGIPPHVAALFDHSLSILQAELYWVEKFMAQK